MTALGVVLLLVSGLSFTRGMQRLYEGAFSLPTRGMQQHEVGRRSGCSSSRCSWPCARWCSAGCTAGSRRSASLRSSRLLWLSRRICCSAGGCTGCGCCPVAVLSVIGMAGVGIWSVLWMPHTIASSADQFGMIGIGFALLTWLVAVAGVLVVAATGGAMISDRLIAWRRPDDGPQPRIAAA